MAKRNYSNKMSYKGKFVPTNPKKYKGNPRNIEFRSMWERRCMVHFDRNENILEWSSEELAIPYQSPLDGKTHRYYPDFLVKCRVGQETKTILIEVKPSKYLKPPNRNRKKTKSYLYEVREYGKNRAKWEAAKKVCDHKGWRFDVWTEHTIGF